MLINRYAVILSNGSGIYKKFYNDEYKAYTHWFRLKEGIRTKTMYGKYAYLLKLDIDHTDILHRYPKELTDFEIKKDALRFIERKDILGY